MNYLRAFERSCKCEELTVANLVGQSFNGSFLCKSELPLKQGKGNIETQILQLASLARPRERLTWANFNATTVSLSLSSRVTNSSLSTTFLGRSPSSCLQASFTISRVREPDFPALSTTAPKRSNFFCKGVESSEGMNRSLSLIYSSTTSSRALRGSLVLVASCRAVWSLVPCDNLMLGLAGSAGKGAEEV